MNSSFFKRASGNPNLNLIVEVNRVVLVDPDIHQELYDFLVNKIKYFR